MRDQVYEQMLLPRCRWSREARMRRNGEEAVTGGRNDGGSERTQIWSGRWTLSDVLMQ